MRFANSIFMLLFIVPVFLIFFFINSRKRTGRDLAVFAEKSLLPKIIDESGQIARQKQWVLRICGLFFLVFALMGPQWGYQWEEIKRKGLEIVFVLDTSKSMLASDIKPSRLERAKLAVIDLIKKFKGDRVGLVAFSGTSFLQCPLTLDYSAFALSLSSLSVNTIPRGGTVLGEAVATARKAYKAGGAGNRIMILITDGENHQGDPVSEAAAAVKEGIKVYTVGIGSPEGELIVVRDEHGNSSYLKDEQGNVVKSSLNEKILVDIAEAGNGAYFRSNTPSLGLEELYTQILAKLEKQEIDAKMRQNYLDRYQMPLFIAFVLFILEFLPENLIITKLLPLIKRKMSNEKVS